MYTSETYDCVHRGRVDIFLLEWFSRSVSTIQYLHIHTVSCILSWSYIREHILLLTIQSDSDEYVFIFRNTMMFISIDEYFLHTQVRVKQVHCVVRYTYTQLLMVYYCYYIIFLHHEIIKLMARNSWAVDDEK